MGGIILSTKFRSAMVQIFAFMACVATCELTRCWLFPLRLQLKSNLAWLPPFLDSVSLMQGLGGALDPKWPMREPCVPRTSCPSISTCLVMGWGSQ